MSSVAELDSSIQANRMLFQLAYLKAEQLEVECIAFQTESKAKEIRDLRRSSFRTLFELDRLQRERLDLAGSYLPNSDGFVYYFDMEEEKFFRMMFPITGITEMVEETLEGLIGCGAVCIDP